MEGGGTTDETSKLGFFSYVFNFDENNKTLISNLFQYAYLAIPLVVIILKLINYYTPADDDTKGSFEITAEILVSVAVILFSIWIINKIIRYIPTISKTPYPIFNEVNFIIPLFILLFTMQTKLGAKINILVDRAVDLYDGKTNLKEKEKQKKDYKTTQPISQHPSHQSSRSDLLNTQTHAIRNPNQTAMLNEVHQQSSLPQRNFNNDFGGPITPLIDAQEPMAANEAMGGMFGGSIF